MRINNIFFLVLNWRMNDSKDTQSIFNAKINTQHRQFIIVHEFKYSTKCNAWVSTVLLVLLAVLSTHDHAPPPSPTNSHICFFSVDFLKQFDQRVWKKIIIKWCYDIIIELALKFMNSSYAFPLLMLLFVRLMSRG